MNTQIGTAFVIVQICRFAWQANWAMRSLLAEIERQKEAVRERAFLNCLQRDADERIAQWRAFFTGLFS